MYQTYIIYFVMLIAAIGLVFFGRFVNKRYGESKRNDHLFNSDDIDRRRVADPGNPFSPFYDSRDHPG
jgi:hypothetical protein